MQDAPRAAPDPTGQQRRADAARHRRAVADALAALAGDGWREIEPDARTGERERATLAAMADGVALIWAAQLPRDLEGGRRGTVDLLVRSADGYVPVLVVRHKVSDPGAGARTSTLDAPVPSASSVDAIRKMRPQPRDQLRLAHVHRMLQACGYGATGRATGGVIGMDGDVVVWHDLEAPTWPGGRTALDEYDVRFADRLAVATAAHTHAPALARPSRIVECRGCPWWPVCGAELTASRDVSLVVRGEDALGLRGSGVRTVDDLARLEPDADLGFPMVGMPMADAVGLARAWLADLAVVRKVVDVKVPRADVEVDVDMESFGDAGAYLWGALLSGVDIGVPQGYRAFATWRPLPDPDEGRSFGEFWQWLTEVRDRAADRGLSFRAYCYNELAENRWLLASTRRFAGTPGVPPRRQVQAFIESDSWVDLFGSVRDHFLCAHGKGLKTIAPVAGFHWRDPEASGENSMRWYRDAVGMETGEPNEDQRRRLLQYNEDDVRATYALRNWMSSDEVAEIPYVGDL
ncbi:putative RecB family nuclease [Labedaea rhizosphaerae]|uniref:Putative RecB family nuclease n=2 Tax=Labedaea rhizosphaerae TaxID=598644 RepID=A0A4R6SNW4_LABRH|nr:putative RecB family nuclease [Labedaea rhizosphaerae]